MDGRLLYQLSYPGVVQQRVPALTRGHKCLFAAGLTWRVLTNAP